jgi:hypothetical protein
MTSIVENMGGLNWRTGGCHPQLGDRDCGIEGGWAWDLSLNYLNQF